MKEITRIHIAKTSYDIETGAKKDLESYLKSLEAYSADTEIMTDVEIRITEILAERGVHKNGVIAEADVTALKEQLGEPRDFMGEGDMAVGDEAAEVASTEPGRKLFRDTDRAVLGGVLAGLAAFTKVDVIWIRLLFIVVALASFGTALLVYVVLWLAVPAARTAAERLQMAGRPVTVSSIRELNESETARPASRDKSNHIGLMLLGVMFSFGALVAAGITIAALTSLFWHDEWRQISAMPGGDPLKAAFWLMFASGVLFVALMVLAAYASFTRKLTKRVAISGGIIIVLGLTAFGGGAGFGMYGSSLRRDFVQNNTRTDKVTVPSDMSGVRELKINSPDVAVSYNVTSLKPYASVNAFAKTSADMPKVTFEKQGKTLVVTVSKGIDDCKDPGWFCDQNPTVELHGPVLERLTAAKDSAIEYGGFNQEKLALMAEDGATVDLQPGYIGNATVTVGREASVVLSDATVGVVDATLKSTASVFAGTIKNLAVTDEGSCPAGERSTRVSAWDVTAGTLRFNGKTQPVAPLDSGCTEIEIEKETER